MHWMRVTAIALAGAVVGILGLGAVLFVLDRGVPSVRPRQINLAPKPNKLTGVHLSGDGTSPATTSDESHRNECMLTAVDAGFTASMFRSGMTLAQVQRARRYALRGHYSAGESDSQRMAPALDAVAPNESDADAYAGAFESCMHFYGIPYEEGSVGSVWVPNPEDANINLGNGIRFPYGISYTDFRYAHHSVVCNDSKSGSVCKFDPIPKGVCITAYASCIVPMTFAFQNNSLIGFAATFGEADWRKLMKATEAVYGQGQQSTIAPSSSNSERSDIVWWRLRLGSFGFVHFATPSVSGSPAGESFSTVFNPEGPPPEAAAEATENHAYGVYRYQSAGLTIGVEIRSVGVAFTVENRTPGAVSFKPSEIEITTTEDTFSPFTIHHMQLMGVGVPGSEVEVGPGKSEPFMLAGFCGKRLGCTTSPVGNPTMTIEGDVESVRVGDRQLEFSSQ
jgi:hypothetical protein